MYLVKLTINDKVAVISDYRALKKIKICYKNQPRYIFQRSLIIAYCNNLCHGKTKNTHKHYWKLPDIFFPITNPEDLFKRITITSYIINICKLLIILTAFACAILSFGLSPSFSIFLITGTYDMGITSTGIPFLN